MSTDTDTPDQTPPAPLDPQTAQLVALFNTLAEDQKAQALSLMADFARNANIKGPSRPAPTTPELREAYGIPLYVKRTNPYEHLKTHYGEWLIHFTPELDRNYLFQADIRRLDPILHQAITNQVIRKRLPSGVAVEKLTDILENQKQRVDIELSQIPEEDIKRYARLDSASRYREKSRNSTPSIDL